MKKITLLLFVLVMQINAGWYEVYTFKGTIGKYPIELWLQVEDGFHKKNEKNLKVIGLYKYMSSNTPIAVQGMMNNKKVEIFVMDGKKKVETFNFDFSKASIVGTWQQSKKKKKLDLRLKQHSTLDDREKENRFSNIEIVQRRSFKEFYFVGVYKKRQNSNDSARMSSLKIMRKKDNSLFQEIDFSKYGVDVGSIMTIIFDNIYSSSEQSTVCNT